MFTKGHKINLGRKNPNAGKKRTIKRQVLDFLADDEANLPTYLSELSGLALNSVDERVKLQALTYLSDRHLGKARISVDQRVTGFIGLITADGMAERIKGRRLEEARLIAQYSVKEVSNAIQREGDEDTATEREEVEAPTE